MANMGFSKYCLLVTATVLFVALENQSTASFISNEISKDFPDSKEKFDIKAAVVGEDRNIISSMATEAVNEVHSFAANHMRTGPIGEAIEMLKDGWEKTIELVSVALNSALDLFDNILGNVIEDKIAALNAINNGINVIRTLIFKAGNEIHSSLASKSKINITDKGPFKYGIEAVQECGSGLFEYLETAQFFALQGVKFRSEVKEKHLKAAHSAIKSAAEMAFSYLVAGAEKATGYLFDSDEEKIVQQEPTEQLISNAAKAAAAADSDTKAALDALNKEFDLAMKMGINPTILEGIKNGLEEYINYSAWAVAICYDAIAQAKVLVKTDSKAVNRIIEDAFQLAKTILIDGSIKGYEGIAYAYEKTGSRKSLHDAIEIVERSRVEGTKAFDSAKIVALRAILTGGRVAEHALTASHKMLEANEAAIFEGLQNVINYIIKLLKSKR